MNLYLFLCWYWYFYIFFCKKLTVFSSGNHWRGTPSLRPVYVQPGDTLIRSNIDVILLHATSITLYNMNVNNYIVLHIDPGKITHTIKKNLQTNDAFTFDVTNGISSITGLVFHFIIIPRYPDTQVTSKVSIIIAKLANIRQWYGGCRKSWYFLLCSVCSTNEPRFSLVLVINHAKKFLQDIEENTLIQRPTTLTDYHHFCEAPQKGNTRNYLLAVKKRALSFNKVVTKKGNNVEMYTTYLTKKENIICNDNFSQNIVLCQTCCRQH